MTLRVWSIILLGLVSCRPFVFVSAITFPKKSYVIEAEAAERAGNRVEAIELYNKHIDERLEVEERPKWENPYFYLMRISDLYLEDDKVIDAIASIEKAEKKGVERTLVADRYRAIGRWLEDRKRFQEAIELLKAHQDLDELLFHADLDRISKEMLGEEANNGEVPTR